MNYKRVIKADSNAKVLGGFEPPLPEYCYIKIRSDNHYTIGPELIKVDHYYNKYILYKKLIANFGSLDPAFLASSS